MKYSMSLVLTFIVASLGWLLIMSGAGILGMIVLGICATFGFWVSVLMAFGSIENYVEYTKELQVWVSHMMP